MGYEEERVQRKFDQLILGSLDHPHFSYMINSSSKGFFESSRGLRLSDPLYLFLFTLVVDSFNALMYKAWACSLAEGYQNGREDISISHLQFVDDTICFLKKLL